jgi:6-phosphogluconolactonase
MVYQATLIVSPNKAQLPSCLNAEIVKIAREAIFLRGVFTIALSGGSLAGFLTNLKDSFRKSDNPGFDRWHIILADERCVPLSDPESNLGALNASLFANIPIPKSQIHGIDETLLLQQDMSDDTTTITTTPTALIAKDYECIVRDVLSKSDGQLDLAVLGFGPDGHTCSLFPNHPLLLEQTLWVASIDDSPKPPPRRITLTYPVLNEHTRHVIFCGAGESKAPILQDIFYKVIRSAGAYTAILKEPATYPCAQVQPNSQGGEENTLIYVVDEDAMLGVPVFHK